MAQKTGTQTLDMGGIVVFWDEEEFRPKLHSTPHRTTVVTLKLRDNHERNRRMLNEKVRGRVNIHGVSFGVSSRGVITLNTKQSVPDIESAIQLIESFVTAVSRIVNSQRRRSRGDRRPAEDERHNAVTVLRTLRYAQAHPIY